MAAQERITGDLLPEDIRTFKQASPEGLIGWAFALFDFVSIPPILSYFPLFPEHFNNLAFFTQLGCHAVGTEAYFYDLSGRLTATGAEATAEKEKAKEALQELEVSRVIAREKEKEVQQAILAKLEAQE